MGVIRYPLKRYSESQFHLYNELWSSLCDLRITGDNLWERASKTNLRKFADQLKQTKDQVTKSSLLIEDDHYRLLKDLLNKFGEFRFGKIKLIELCGRSRLEFADTEILRTIEQNRRAKERYSELLDQIEHSLRRQLRGVT